MAECTNARLSNLLFYIEPVVFREKPMLLEPWVLWLSQVANAQRHVENFRMAVFSSPWLCERFKALAPGVEIFPVLPTTLLTGFGMDRIAYARDLTLDRYAPPVNAPLINALDVACEAFKPDMILSFSQNRYISARSGPLCTIFSEMQPLPRTLGEGFFLDSAGHQADSLLATERGRISARTLTESCVDRLAHSWENGLNAVQRATPGANELSQWIRHKAAGAPVAMFALQPSDWLTFEGISNFTAMDSALMAWLAALPPDWKAIATYHPAAQLSCEVEDSIAAQMGNLILLPEDWRQGRSEMILQMVDAVVTISSAVGWTGVISGKPTVTLGRSNLIGYGSLNIDDLNHLKPVPSDERWALLDFLMSRYCVSKNSYLNECGYAHYILDKILKYRIEYYFH